jgi:hypothetical protein
VIALSVASEKGRPRGGLFVISLLVVAHFAEYCFLLAAKVNKLLMLEGNMRCRRSLGEIHLGAWFF